MLMALDLATVTGVAVGQPDGEPKAFTVRFADSGATQEQRFYGCLLQVDHLIKQYQPSVVAVEKAIAAGVKGGEERVQLAMGWRAIVKLICHKRRVRFREYDVQSIRAHFCGPGASRAGRGKPLAMARCHLLGWKVQSEDESDACAVWDYTRAKLYGIGSPPPFGLLDA